MPSGPSPAGPRRREQADPPRPGKGWRTRPARWRAAWESVGTNLTGWRSRRRIMPTPSPPRPLGIIVVEAATHNHRDSRKPGPLGPVRGSPDAEWSRAASGCRRSGPRPQQQSPGTVRSPSSSPTEPAVAAQSRRSSALLTVPGRRGRPPRTSSAACGSEIERIASRPESPRPWNAFQLGPSIHGAWLTRGERPTRRATRPGSCPSASASAI